MISQKFSNASANQIALFISESDHQQEDNNLLDSIESVSDLWVLANMNKTFNEENKVHRSVADSHPDVCSPS